MPSVDDLPLMTDAEQSAFDRYDNMSPPVKALAQLNRGVMNFPAAMNDINSLAWRILNWSGVPGADQYVKRGDEMSQNYRDTVSNISGTPEGSKWYETVPEAVGTAVVPVPGGPGAAIAGRSARAAGSLIDGLLIPGTVNPTVRNLATNAGVAAAVDQAVQPEGLVKQGAQAVGNALIPEARAAQPSAPFSSTGLGSIDDQPIVAPEKAFLGNAHDVSGSIDDQPIIGPTGEQLVDTNSFYYNHKTAIIGTILGAGAATLLALKYKKYMEPPTPSLTTLGQQRNVTSMGTAIKQGVVDAEAPLFDNLPKGPQQDAVRDLLYIGTRQGADTSAFEFLKTGEAPRASPIRVEPFGKAKIQYEAQDEATRKLIDDGMIARTLLDQRAEATRIRGTPTTPDRVINPATGARYTDAELRGMSLAAQTNPVARGIIDIQRSNLDAVLEHAVNSGVESRTSARNFRRVNPNFSHLTDLEDQPNKIKQFFGNSSVGDQVAESFTFAKRAYEEMGGVKQPLNATQANEVYIMSKVAGIERTRAINQILKVWEGFDPQTVKRLADSKGSNFSTRMRGDTVYYKITDENMLKALQIDPYTTYEPFNTMRRWWSQGVTGKLRPIFSIAKAWLYDVPMIAATRPEGHALSYLDNFVQNRTGGQWASVVGPVDPSAYLSALSGVGKHITSNMSFTASMRLEKALANNDYITSILGAPRTRALANDLFDRYINTFLHNSNRYGGVDTSLYKDQINGVQTYAKELTGHPLGAIYNHILEGFHTGARLQQAYLSYGRNSMSEAVAAARNAVGDVTRSGNNSVYRFIANAVPFANVATQEAHKFGKWANDNRGKAMTTILMSVALPKVLEHMIWSGDDRYREYYYKNLRDDVKAAHLVVPNPMSTDPADYIALPMNPLFAAMGNLAGDLFSYSLDLHGQPTNEIKDMIRRRIGIAPTSVTQPGVEIPYFDAAKQSALNALIPPLPPPVVAGTEFLTGSKPQLGDRFGQMTGPIQQDRTPGALKGGKIMGDSFDATLQAVLSATFGTVADTFFDSINEAEMGARRRGVPGALENLGQYFADNTKKSFPEIFTGSLQDSTYTGIKRTLTDKSQGIDTAVAEYNKFATGGVRRGAAVRPLPAGDLPPQAGDPEMLTAAQYINTAGFALTARRQEINDVRESINRVRGSSSMDHNERQRTLRELSKIEQDKTEALLALIRSYEMNIANTLGKPTFDFSQYARGPKR